MREGDNFLIDTLILHNLYLSYRPLLNAEIKKDIFKKVNKKQELIKRIQESDISEDDKKEWEFLVDSSPDDFVSNLLEMYSKFPAEIGWFNDIYKRKKTAFALMENEKEKSESMLSEIFEEEKRKLEELGGAR